MDGSDCKSSTVADTVVTLVSRVVRAVFREVSNARISDSSSLRPIVGLYKIHLLTHDLPEHSLIPIPSLSPVFDCIKYASTVV